MGSFRDCRKETVGPTRNEDFRSRVSFINFTHYSDPHIITFRLKNCFLSQAKYSSFGTQSKQVVVTGLVQEAYGGRFVLVGGFSFTDQ